MSFVNYKLIVTDSNGPMLEKYPITMIGNKVYTRRKILTFARLHWLH